jgi:phenylacetate-CoA ligase
MYWNKEAECMSAEEKKKLQSERLVKLVKYVYDNVEFYRNKMDKAGVAPEDIKSIDDITKLPYTTKNDLRDTYPFGLFAAKQSDIVRVHASSGTTGKATGKYAPCHGHCHPYRKAYTIPSDYKHPLS